MFPFFINTSFYDYLTDVVALPDNVEARLRAVGLAALQVVVSRYTCRGVGECLGNAGRCGVLLDVGGVKVLRTADETDGAVGLDSLASVAADGQRSTLHVEVARILVLMVYFHAGVALLQFHLNAVVASSRDVHRTALHQEVLLAVDGILHGSRDIEGEVLDFNIFLTIDGMLRVAHDIERPLALQFAL